MSRRTAVRFGWVAVATLWAAGAVGAQQPTTTGTAGTNKKLTTGTQSLGGPTTKSATGSTSTGTTGGFGQSGTVFGGSGTSFSGFGGGVFAMPRLTRDQELELLTEATVLAGALISELNIQFPSEFDALMFLMKVYELKYMSALMGQMSGGQGTTNGFGSGGTNTSGFGSFGGAPTTGTTGTTGATGTLGTTKTRP